MARLLCILFFAVVFMPILPFSVPAQEAAPSTTDSTSTEAVNIPFNPQTLLDGSPRFIAYSSLVEASSLQKDVLAIISDILSRQRMTSSDGQILMDLDILIQDETKIRDGIVELGPRTLGRTVDQLADGDRQLLNSLTQNQQISTDRYTRIQQSIERNALSRPESVFGTMLVRASEFALSDHLALAPQLISGNQLTKAIVEVNQALEGLKVLRDLLGSSVGDTGRTEETGSEAKSFGVPSLWGKEGVMAMPFFNWQGASMDFLLIIPESIEQLEKIAKEQREIATTVAQMPAQPDAGDPKALTGREYAINKAAIEVATQVGVIDPNVDTAIRSGAESAKKSGDLLAVNNIPTAVGTTEQAAVELETAAKMLKARWEEIMDRLTEWTRQAEGIAATSMGIPHGFSKKRLEELRKVLLSLLRATGSLSQAIVMERGILNHTTARSEGAGEPAFDILAASQTSVIGFLSREVIPYEEWIMGSQVTGATAATTATGATKGATAHDLIVSASGAMKEAGEALQASNPPPAIVKEKQAVVEMEDALADMIYTIQNLLGQFAPQAMGPSTTIPRGRSMRPPDGEKGEKGWDWGLPPRELDKVTAVFRGGEFPDKYDREIKLYFNSIAGTEEEKKEE